MKWKFWILPGLLVSAAACSGIQPPNSAPSDVVVELDAFSGRPNPSWTLTRDDASSLARHVADATPRSRRDLPAQGLGFRGFAVRNPGGDAGLAESLYVTRAGELVDPVNGSIYADAPRAAAFLRELAAKNGFEQVVAN